MPEPLVEGLARLRTLLLDADGLVRAVASGRRRGTQPPWRRVELRYVDLRAGRHLQRTCYDQTQAHTANAAVGPEAEVMVDDLLAEPYAAWHVDSTEATTQLRVTKRGEAQVSRTAVAADAPVRVERSHDRVKQRLLDPQDPWLVALGISAADGRVKPTRQAKLRQVEEFCRLLAATVDDALAGGQLRGPPLTTRCGSSTSAAATPTSPSPRTGG